MVGYRKGSYRILPPLHSYGQKLVQPSNPNTLAKHQLSKSAYTPAQFFCDPKKIVPFQTHIAHRKFKFYDIETRLIWAAFDTPEKIPILFNDYVIRGYEDIFSSGSGWIERALHWVREARFWRSIGIHTPFFDHDKLRIHCDQEGENGVLRFSTAMLHAVMDLERAHKRKEMGLPPNYLWDNWGPCGFIDGRYPEYLPRMYNVPTFADPDNVEVEESEVLPFVTGDALKERYGEFIFPEENPLKFEGAFLSSPSHGNVLLGDLNAQAVKLYSDLFHTMNVHRGGGKDDGMGKNGENEKVEEGEGEKQQEFIIPTPQERSFTPNSTQSVALHPPNAMRSLFYLSADPALLDQLGPTPEAWADVEAFLSPFRQENEDLKIDAARMMLNTTRSVDECRRFFEEKCGFQDFMTTSDKSITGGVMAYLTDLITLLEQHGDWGKELCIAQTDLEKREILGERAFAVFRHIEDVAFEKRRKDWATRFSGEAKEEATLDYMLKNFSKRAETGQTRAAAYGEEYDREYEPVGRNVQRRVLTSDVQMKKKSVTSKQRGAKTDLFSELDNMQTG